MSEPVPATEAVTTPESTSRERVLRIPELALVMLIGSSGSGKSTFAAQHFRPTEVLSSDQYRGVVGDDPNDQTVTNTAFAALHHIAGLRLQLGRLTVIDATNVKPQDRAASIKIARDHDVLPVAIVLNLDERTCHEHNAARPERQFGAHVVRNHIQALRRGLRDLEREGFRQVYILNSPAEVAAARIERTKLFSDKRNETGPFDIIGDIHGCYDELLELLGELGYVTDAERGMVHPTGRRAIFLGDLVDRGPKTVEVVDLVCQMVAQGTAFCVPGNHDEKLAKYLAGRQVKVAHGLAETISQITALPETERAIWSQKYRAFSESWISHYVLDGGKLVVAHAGMKQEYQMRTSGRVRAFALYGETTGETDEFGLPERGDWAANYRGPAKVVFGHTPVAKPQWLNNTLNIDTGCVYGGRLTALLWPEEELVSVPARAMYAESKRPFLEPDVSQADTTPAALLRIEDAQGKQVIATRLLGKVIIEADRTAAALEVMSRFALDPRWLIYLPPTMSPSETATIPDYLEYPTEALAYFRKQGVAQVICEEKHMGSRAVVVVCRDDATAERRFGVPADGLPGACYTRTGRQFFEDRATNRAFITRLSAAFTQAGAWERYGTDWLAFDAEILPWNTKAQSLLREQYAPVAAAGAAVLPVAAAAVAAGLARGLDLGPLAERLHAQQANLTGYSKAYAQYCWELQGLDGVRVAPFYLLASEGQTYLDHDHAWHMQELARLATVDPLFLATQHQIVDLADAAACAAAVQWWEDLTGRGGEGMVVKPLAGMVHQGRRLVQPAIKCRGREYLRIIYGPDYTLPMHLEQLKKRGLTTKRNLALREFALGIEALERFTGGAPLWQVHQAVFGVLALESEPVDPRL